MNKLYKATVQGNVEMTPEEEKEVRDLWAKEEGKALPKVKPSLESRLDELEVKFENLQVRLSTETVVKKGV